MPPVDPLTVSATVLYCYPDILEVLGKTKLHNSQTFTLLRCRKTATVYALSNIDELRMLARQLA